MKKFSRCALILISVLILGGIGGYIYGDKVLQPTYTSVSELYVIPGVDNEASLRSVDGGLKQDFAEVIVNSIVIADAKKNVGTSENIANYISVSTPKDSNIVRIICVNPDAGTAKKYVDAVAMSAVNNIKKVIPVENVSILSTGTVQSEPSKPELVYYIVEIALISAAVCLLVEIIVLLSMSAFKKVQDNSDDELDYERNYGKYAVINRDDVKVLKEAMTEIAVAKTMSGEKRAKKSKKLDDIYHVNKDDSDSDRVKKAEGDFDKHNDAQHESESLEEDNVSAEEIENNEKLADDKVNYQEQSEDAEDDSSNDESSDGDSVGDKWGKGESVDDEQKGDKSDKDELESDKFPEEESDKNEEPEEQSEDASVESADDEDDEEEVAKDDEDEEDGVDEDDYDEISDDEEEESDLVDTKKSESSKKRVTILGMIKK